MPELPNPSPLPGRAHFAQAVCLLVSGDEQSIEIYDPEFSRRVGRSCADGGRLAKNPLLSLSWWSVAFSLLIP